VNRRNVLIAAGALATIPFPAVAQRPVTRPRIGLLWIESGSDSIVLTAFREGLRAQGYVEGKNIEMIVNAIAGTRLPAIYGSADDTDAGGLISYGPNWSDGFRSAAGFVARILKGARPADMPFEQPTRFELAVNLKAAKAIGITIPPSILQRADKVIE
jgi:hypothetical protein